jgi:hypothetical protein
MARLIDKVSDDIIGHLVPALRISTSVFNLSKWKGQSINDSKGKGEGEGRQPTFSFSLAK